MTSGHCRVIIRAMPAAVPAAIAASQMKRLGHYEQAVLEIVIAAFDKRRLFGLI